MERLLFFAARSAGGGGGDAEEVHEMDTSVVTPEVEKKDIAPVSATGHSQSMYVEVRLGVLPSAS